MDCINGLTKIFIRSIMQITVPEFQGPLRELI